MFKPSNLTLKTDSLLPLSLASCNSERGDFSEVTVFVYTLSTHLLHILNTFKNV